MFGFRKYVSWRQTSGTTATQIWQLLAQLQQRHTFAMARACTYAWACAVLLSLSGALLLAERGAAAQAATVVRAGAVTGLLGCLAMALYAIGLPLL